MGSKSGTSGPRTDRDQRLKQALKANLQRRKAQARVRATGSGQETAAQDTSSQPEAEADSGAVTKQNNRPNSGRETGQDG